MKVPATGRGRPPEIRTETLHYWPFDDRTLESGQFIDLMPAVNRSFDASYGLSYGALGPTGQGVFFTWASPSEHVISIHPEPDPNIFNNGYTISLWVRLMAIPATYATFIANGSVGEISLGVSTNTRMWFGVKNVGGQAYVTYAAADASGIVDEAVFTSIGPLGLGQWYFLSMTVTEDEGFTEVTMFRNGETIPLGTRILDFVTSYGEASLWHLGYDYGLPGNFYGQISHISFVTRVLEQEEIRSDFRRGMLWDLDTSIHLQAKTFNYDTGVITDLTNLRGTDYVLGASVSDEASALCANATVHLRRDDNLNSLAKFMNDSPLNRNPIPSSTNLGPDNTAYAPLLEVRHNIQLFAARIPAWDKPKVTDWVQIFHGNIDKIDWGRPTIELTCRDPGGDLIDSQIEDHPDSGVNPARLRYGSVPEVPIQVCFDNGNVLTQVGTGKSIGGSVLTDAPLYDVLHIGFGLNDLIRLGTLSVYAGSDKIKVVITGTGSPNTFAWYRSGQLQATNVPITGSAQSLIFGIQIAFSSTTGHTLNDVWVFQTPMRIYVPVDPNVYFSTYFQDQTNIMDALNQKAEMIGWVVRHVYHPFQGNVLCLFEPDRDKILCDYSVGDMDYFDITEMAIDLADIRNVVEVSFPNSGKANPENRPTPTKQATYPQAAIIRTAQQAIPGSTSMLQYGRRYMSVAEEQASRIDTFAEATDFADAMLKDLSQPRATKSVDMRCMFEIEYNDHVNFLPNGVHYSVEEQLAVTSLTHDFSLDGTARTNINLRGKPSGNRRRALAKAANSYYDKPDMMKSFDQEGVLGHVRDTLKPHLDVRETDFETGRDSPTTNVINHRFITQIRGAQNPPDGWDLTAGVWGETDDAFDDLVTVLSGIRSVALLKGAAILLSHFIPVQKAGWYQASATWQASLAIAGPTLTLNIHWYDNSSETATLLSTSPVFTKAANADGVWQTNRGEVQADPDALWAKMEFSRTVVVGEIVHIDNVDFQPFDPSFVGVSSTDLNSQTVNTWVKVTNLDFDTFTALQDGLFDISARVMVDVDNIAATHSTAKIKLTKNTVDWRFGDAHSRSAADGDYVTLRVDAFSAPLDAGDVIEVYVTDTENDFDIVGGSGETEFSARLAGNQ